MSYSISSIWGAWYFSSWKVFGAHGGSDCHKRVRQMRFPNGAPCSGGRKTFKSGEVSCESTGERSPGGALIYEEDVTHARYYFSSFLSSLPPLYIVAVSCRRMKTLHPRHSLSPASASTAPARGRPQPSTRAWRAQPRETALVHTNTQLLPPPPPSVATVDSPCMNASEKMVFPGAGTQLELAGGRTP